MTEPIWLEPEFLLTLHHCLLARFGGIEGLRDPGLLDFAINKPRQFLAYGSPSLFDLAASYSFGIVKNYPFLDGNKRTGFMAAYSFLGANGLHLQAPEAEAVVFTVALAAGDISPEHYAAWLEANCVPATQDVPGE